MSIIPINKMYIGDRDVSKPHFVTALQNEIRFSPCCVIKPYFVMICSILLDFGLKLLSVLSSKSWT